MDTAIGLDHSCRGVHSGSDRMWRHIWSPQVGWTAGEEVCTAAVTCKAVCARDEDGLA